MGEQQTIFALATPPGRSALAVFRVSGPRALATLKRLTGGDVRPRRPCLRALYDTAAEKIDDAVVTAFPGPGSFTGEDCVEISVHGARSVIAALNATLSGIEGLRLADPGEFTRRAFLNGRLDLTQAEAIADLIDSETEFQRRQALRVLSGEFGNRLRAWSADILAISAQLESALDFSDEGDVDSLDAVSLCEASRRVTGEIEDALRTATRSLALRAGFTVVISGPPNAGKSTLFNALVGEDAAIVTATPGTTRDLLSRNLDLDGVPVTLVDTAGIREARDEVEAIGVARAREASRHADLNIELCPPGVRVDGKAGAGLVVHSKTDLSPPPDGAVGVCSGDPESVASLRRRISEIALSVVGDGSEGRLIRERHVLALTEANGSLEQFRLLLDEGQLELAAEDLRAARAAIGSIIGATTTEDVLGAIFARFCIGK